ncbi:MAG: helix-turn-helix domain-containing protein [Halorubrum sp.]
MGAGIRAEVSLPASSLSPFDGLVDGSTAIYNIVRTRLDTRPTAESFPESDAGGTDDERSTPANTGSDARSGRADQAEHDGNQTTADQSTNAGTGDRIVIEFLADADLDVPEGIETVFDYGEKAAFRFETPCSDTSPFAVLDRHGVPATEMVVRDGRLLVTFHATDLPTLRAVLKALQESCVDLQVLRLLQSSSTPEESDLVTFDRSELTERQREVLAAAHDAGYFDHPKGANAGEVAESLGIDRSTFAEHIAAVQRKVFGTVLD